MAVAQLWNVRPHHAHDKNITASWFGDIGFSHRIFYHRRWISDFWRRCSGLVSHHDGFDFVRHDDFSRRLSCQRTFGFSPQQTAIGLDYGHEFDCHDCIVESLSGGCGSALGRSWSCLGLVDYCGAHETWMF